MMHKVKFNISVKPFPNEVNAKLPKIVMDMKIALTLAVQARPAWQVEVHPMDTRQRFRSKTFLDRVSVALPSDHPHFMEPRDLADPVPSHAWFRSRSWFACVSRDENSHISLPHVPAPGF